METELVLRLNPRVLQANREWVSVALHRLEASELPAFRGLLHANGRRQILAGPRREVEQVCSTAGAAGAAVIEALEGFEKATHVLRFGSRSMTLGRETLLMGVLNATPDSFYDGGSVRAPDEAIQKGLRMAEQGAAVVDVGGESTRPGSDPVSAEEELRRVLPVVRGLASRGVVVSIDTSKARVAREAIEAGAQWVNDVTALGDPEMAEVVARAKTALVLMHIKGTPKSMQQNPVYDDIMEELTRYLRERALRAVRQGVDRESILVDPGIGFGKRFEDNFTILKRLAEFRSLGFPVLVGPSRKAFIGATLDGRPPTGRLHGTLGAVAACVLNGAHAVRVHDVAESLDAARVADKIKST